MAYTIENIRTGQLSTYADLLDSDDCVILSGEIKGIILHCLQCGWEISNTDAISDFILERLS